MAKLSEKVDVLRPPSDTIRSREEQGLVSEERRHYHEQPCGWYKQSLQDLGRAHWSKIASPSGSDGLLPNGHRKRQSS